MSWRTVIVSSNSKLDLQLGFMQVRSRAEVKRIVLDEIDILLVESTAVSMTAALLAELTQRKVKVIFCDRKHFPIAELTPFHGCHDTNRRLHSQLEWTNLARAKIWQSIVRRKITHQRSLLIRRGKRLAADLLAKYVDEVNLGDTANREGLAAKAYFTALYGNGFTREKPCAVNAGLDYGYQILLAVFARELACEGYLTQLGIFHDNVFNNYNLCSDLVEPFRPWVDRVVTEWFDFRDAEFDKDLRRKLVGMLQSECRVGETRQTLIKAIIDYTRSVTSALSDGETDKIRFVEFEC